MRNLQTYTRGMYMKKDFLQEGLKSFPLFTDIY